MNRLFLSSVLLAGCTATVATAPPPNNPPPQRTVVVEQAPPPAPPPTVVVAAPPSKHPAYIHALTDLRTARSFLARPAGKMMVKWDENRAIREIDAAIKEIKEASIDDGKNIDDHPPVDAAMIWGDRLHKSLELVETARRDLNEEEDNGFARGLKARAIGHVDIASRDIKEGIEDAAHMPAPQVVVVAAPPSKHPAYLHALTDLRTARSFLQRPAGKLQVKWDENRAIREIDAAIKEIKEASIDDGKNIEDHPPVDVAMVWGDRLHKSLELVETARRDLNEEEDNGFARGLKARAIGHVDLAARNIKEGVEDASHMPPPVAVAVVAAPGPGAHPAYLHALTDLRTARGLLEKPARPDVKWDEQNAIREIDAAINEIKGAAIDDGKPLNDHPAIDAHLAHRDRLKQAQELLHKAAHDIDEREDNNFAKGLRARANGHINNAEHAVHEAVEDRHH